MKLKEARSAFLDGYFSTHERNQKTKSAYSSDLKQFEGFAGADLQLDAMTASLVESWAADLKKSDYAPASIKRKLVSLKVFCSYWVRRSGLPQSPFWQAQLNFGRIMQLPRTLTEGEMRALLAQSRRPVHSRKRVGSSYRDLRNVALIDLLFATGLRVGEVSGLDLEDYILDDALLKVHGKGGRERVAFLIDETTIRIQQRHLDARKRINSDVNAVFVNASGTRLKTQGISKILAKLCSEAGIQRRITPHMLRHTVATLLLKNGADIRVIQEFLGHASITTTQRYTHIAKGHLVEALRRHHPSLNLLTST